MSDAHTHFTVDQPKAELPVYVVTLNKDLKGREAITAAAEQLNALITERKPSTLIVDISPVDPFPANLLGSLLKLNSALKAQQGNLIIAGDPTAQDVFKKTRLDLVLNLVGNREEALGLAYSASAPDTQANVVTSFNNGHTPQVG